MTSLAPGCQHHGYSVPMDLPLITRSQCGSSLWNFNLRKLIFSSWAFVKSKVAEYRRKIIYYQPFIYYSILSILILLSQIISSQFWVTCYVLILQTLQCQIILLCSFSSPVSCRSYDMLSFMDEKIEA